MTHSPELLNLARKCVWFKHPDQTLRYPEHFIAHVLTYGTAEDILVLKKYYSDDKLREALEQAPSGVFDKKSWSYWHVILKGQLPEKPLPERRIKL